MGKAPKMCCCTMTTGAVMIGTLQAVIVAVMLAGSALILARYRHWKMLEYHPYYTTTVPTTSTAATVYTLPYYYPFPYYHSVTTGWTVTFSGTTNAAAANYENIEIDLQCTTQGTTPLMVQARYGAMWLNNGNTQHVARNTYRNGVWDLNEEQSGTLGVVTTSDAFTIQIQDMGTYFEITITDANIGTQEVYQYMMRLSPSCINQVYINGTFTMSSISFVWTDGATDPTAWDMAWLEHILAHNIGFCAVWLATLVPYAMSLYYEDPILILPNLAVNIISVFAILTVGVSMGWRLLDAKPSYYQTDEFGESVISYALMCVTTWLLVSFIFIFCVWKFYKYMKKVAERGSDRQQLSNWDGNDKY